MKTFRPGALFGLDNVRANLDAIRRATPVKKLKGMFAGMGALVVGAGPSADLLWDLALPERRGFIMIAVDRIYGKTQTEGYEPDYVVSQDYHGATGGFPFRHGSASLLFHQAAAPEFVRRWRGNLVTSSIPGGVPGFGSLDWGHHAGHAACALAELLGCSPVVMVGIDLAPRSWDRKGTHAEGAGEDPPWDRRGYMIPSVTGGVIETHEDFAPLAGDLSAAIRGSRTRFIQTSDFGAYIDGADHMRIRDAIGELE